MTQFTRAASVRRIHLPLERASSDGEVRLPILQPRRRGPAELALAVPGMRSHISHGRRFHARRGSHRLHLVRAPVEPPRQIGRYVVDRELDGGGFGTVFKAWDPQVERWVAIKIPRADTGRGRDALKRFAREGKSAGRLKHAGIVPVLTVEQVGEVPFIVSEFVDGVTLHHRLKAGPVFSLREAAEFVKAVAAAVAHAHSKQVIHRDIKPKNIIIASEDGKPRLLDFGLARRDIDDSITLPNHVLGTPGYMSPEQAAGRTDEVDHRTDIYSLGVVLYELLTGEPPFRGEPRMVIRQVIEEEPRNPRSLDEEIPLDLETICLHAMEKEAKKRYQTAEELAEELQCWLDHKPIKARPISQMEKARRWCRRNPLTTVLTTTIVLVLATSSLGGVLLAAAKQRALTTTERLLREKESLLAAAFLERANRYLSPGTPTDAYSPQKSLPWLYAAAQLDDQNPERREASRIRLVRRFGAYPESRRPGGMPINSASRRPRRRATVSLQGTRTA